jgi:hypothetical protein
MDLHPLQPPAPFALAMIGDRTAQLRSATLLQLGALQVVFRSGRWQEHLASATREQYRRAADLELLVEARFHKLQSLSPPDLQECLAAHTTSLSEAVEDVADALDDIRNVGKVLDAAEQLVQVSGHLTATR